jgi:hypothetical protein
MNQYRNMGWLDDHSLKRHFPLGVDGSYSMRDKVAGSFKAQVSNVILSSYYSGSPYGIQEFMNDIYAGTWENLLAGRAPTDGDKTLQKTMVAMFCEPFQSSDSSSDTALQGYRAYAPSVEDIILYRLDDSRIVERYAGIFRLYESKHGHGSVAALLQREDGFGPAGMGIQREVDVSAIDNSADFLIDLAIRSRDLLRKAVANSTGSTRAHYQALLIKINTAFKDKL